MSLILTADHHFNHPGILNSCARPFASAAEMDDALVANWNAVVLPGDDVLHLGDFAWRMKPARLEPLFERLNGNKYLLPGNHDDKYVRRLPWKGILPQVHEVKVGDETLVLSHYPIRSWNKSRYGARHLYGHVHGRIPATRQSIDVGVDSHGYRPVPLARLLALMNSMPPLEFHNGGRIVSYADTVPEPWTDPEADEPAGPRGP